MRKFSASGLEFLLWRISGTPQGIYHPTTVHNFRSSLKSEVSQDHGEVDLEPDKKLVGLLNLPHLKIDINLGRRPKKNAS